MLIIFHLAYFDALKQSEVLAEDPRVSSAGWLEHSLYLQEGGEPRKWEPHRGSQGCYRNGLGSRESVWGRTTCCRHRGSPPKWGPPRNYENGGPPGFPQAHRRIKDGMQRLISLKDLFLSLSIYVCVHVGAGAHGGQKRASDLREPPDLGAGNRMERADTLLTTEPSLKLTLVKKRLFTLLLRIEPRASCLCACKTRALPLTCSPDTFDFQSTSR